MLHLQLKHYYKSVTVDVIQLRVKHLIRKAKEEYFIKKINECQGDQKKLFQIVDKLLGCNKSTSLPHFTDSKIMARIFNEFFFTKISDIRCLLSTWESSATVMACPPLNSLLTASKSKLQIFKPIRWLYGLLSPRIANFILFLRPVITLRFTVQIDHMIA